MESQAMSTDTPSNEAPLETFLDTVGRSLTDAQDSLDTGLDLKTSFVLANAELEIKAAVNLDAKGRTVVQPISTQDIREGGIDPGLLSTVRIGFTAAARDLPPTSGRGGQPTKQPEDVIKEIRSHPDVATLEKILGTLDIGATYVPEEKRWLVLARDQKGRLVREAILPDEREERDVD